MIKKLIYAVVTVAAGCGLSGCSLDVPYENQFSDPDAISTPGAARELLAYAYSNLPNLEFDLSVLSDDFSPTYWARTTTTINTYNWQPQALQDLTITAWPQYYAVISTINALQERLPAVTVKGPAEQRLVDEIRAEALTLKAYCYFQLLRLYGPDYADSPDADAIVLKDKVAMESLPRSSVSATVSAIRGLLAEAMRVENRTMGGTHWLTLNAARYLAAEVELYAGKYADAARYASLVIDAVGLDALAPAVYAGLWGSETCAERIFTYGNVKTAESFYISLVYDRDAGDYYAVNGTLAASYADGDCRKEWSVYPVTTSTLGYQPYLGKYNALRKQQQTISLINKLRLSGACFILAQAYCLDGQNGDKAVDMLNDYLTRRGAAPVDDSLRGDRLLKAILTEKQKEFVGEGERYFDLKHYRNSVLSDWTVSQPAERRISATDYRWNWPIPREEYLYNDQMSQNPGWPKNSYNN